MRKINVLLCLLSLIMGISALHAQNKGSAKKETIASPAGRPNIIVIMPDDVGYWNVGAYNNGMMVPTPNIDRIANEGMLFTDHYAAPTCTPGRAMMITGQLPVRTGLTTVGMAGSPVGLSEKDPTLAELLKPLGYKTGQFGKNHLGDRNEHLPTVHGFDEFYGNLYHLNTEEEPFLQSWPKDPGFNNRYWPRGVLDCVASETDDPNRRSHALERSVNKKSRIPGHLTPKEWKPWMKNSWIGRLSFVEKAQKRESLFLPGSIPPGCTFTHT